MRGRWLRGRRGDHPDRQRAGHGEIEPPPNDDTAHRPQEVHRAKTPDQHVLELQVLRHLHRPHAQGTIATTDRAAIAAVRAGALWLRDWPNAHW